MKKSLLVLYLIILCLNNTTAQVFVKGHISPQRVTDEYFVQRDRMRFLEWLVYDTTEIQVNNGNFEVVLPEGKQYLQLSWFHWGDCISVNGKNGDTIIINVEEKNKSDILPKETRDYDETNKYLLHSPSRFLLALPIRTFANGYFYNNLDNINFGISIKPIISYRPFYNMNLFIQTTTTIRTIWTKHNSQDTRIRPHFRIKGLTKGFGWNLEYNLGYLETVTTIEPLYNQENINSDNKIKDGANLILKYNSRDWISLTLALDYNEFPYSQWNKSISYYLKSSNELLDNCTVYPSLKTELYYLFTNQNPHLDATPNMGGKFDNGSLDLIFSCSCFQNSKIKTAIGYLRSDKWNFNIPNTKNHGNGFYVEGEINCHGIHYTTTYTIGKDLQTIEGHKIYSITNNICSNSSKMSIICNRISYWKTFHNLFSVSSGFSIYSNLIEHKTNFTFEAGLAYCPQLFIKRGEWKLEK